MLAAKNSRQWFQAEIIVTCKSGENSKHKWFVCLFHYFLFLNDIYFCSFSFSFFAIYYCKIFCLANLLIRKKSQILNYAIFFVVTKNDGKISLMYETNLTADLNLHNWFEFSVIYQKSAHFWVFYDRKEKN